jgi:hypothetical protein
MRIARSAEPLLVAAMMTGCLVQKPPEPAPAVFGGRGAVIDGAKEHPLTPGDDKAKAGPCAQPSPPSDVTLLDDFEDGDDKPFKGFQREAWWFSASDNTDGSNIYPAGTFAPDKLPATQASKANQFAAHFKAKGQKDWGATWGTTLRWADKGIKCPFNGSAFTGIKFRAKGPADIRVSFGLPETFPPDSGGACQEGCWDSHGMPLHLTDKWDEYIVRWDRVQQGGWGAQARFDPGRLLGVSFSVNAKEIPVDFWIDDIEFLGGAAPAAKATKGP